MKTSSRRSYLAFTRIELVFTLCAIALVAAVSSMGARAVAKQRAIQGCIANLKHLNLAFHLWIDEHEVITPPWRIPVAEKGTFGLEPSSLSGETWFQFAVLSNELGSPKFLADPGDKGARVAATWDSNPEVGFAAPRFRDNATSYAISLDQVWSRTGPSHPDAAILFKTILFSDRHLSGSNETQFCSLSGLNASTFREPFDVWWSSDVHNGEAGRLALIDGSVQQMSSQEVKRLLPASTEWSSSASVAHFLFPKRRAEKVLRRE